MPAHKGIRADAKAIESLIKEKDLLIKQLVGPSRRKTLDRARKGNRMSFESMQYLAQVFNVDIADISLEEDKPHMHKRFASMKFFRTESLKGFPKDFMEVTDFEAMDLLNPMTIEARFEVDDPTDEQAEIAAIIVDSVEAIIKTQKPSAMIRAKGKLNSTIKKLTELGIYLYVGSYKHRHSAMPFIDAGQTEVAASVIFERLLLVFTESRKSRAIQRQVDLGMSLNDMEQDTEWVNDLINRAEKGELDEESIRYLDKIRDEAKHIFIDLKI